jgi:uncharacterized protein YlxP (DUF503 family)
MRAMIGVATLELSIEGAQSLKDKRSILQSLIRRARAQFNIAAAEIDDLDMHQSSIVAFVTLGNDSRLVNSQLSKIVTWVETEYHDVEVLDHTIEIF